MWKIPAAKAYGGILLTKGGRILLREPANHYDGYVWTYSKGRPDSGETPDQTALREVREETGFEAEIIDVLPGVFKGGTTTTAFFVMRHRGQKRNFNGRETASVRWAEFGDAERLIARSTNAIGRVRDLSILSAARAWYQANRAVELPDDDYSPFPARSYDWGIQPMPARHAVLDLDFSLTAAEADRIRMGFIPQDQGQHWFSYFEDGILYQHRSATGYCIDKIYFVPDGEGLRATHAEINRDAGQYTSSGDEEDIRRIEGMVRELANLIEEAETPFPLADAIELAAQPNYLGSPDVVASLLQEFFSAHEPGPSGLPDWFAKQAANQRLTKIMSGDESGYTLIPGWHTEAALGKNLIAAFNLDQDYCSGEELAFIISEALAALSMAIDAAVKNMGLAVAESENPEDYVEAKEGLQALFNFTVQSFMGTQALMSPGKALKDFMPDSL